MKRFEKKPIISRAFKSTIAIGLCFAFVLPASAAGISDAKKEKSSLESELQEIEDSLSDLKSKSKDTSEYLKQLDQNLSALSGKLTELQQDLEAKKEQLEQTKAELAQAQETEVRQYEDMKKRIKYLYENGSEAYLEMILEAKDFADFLNKADYVQQMSEYDRNMLIEYQNTKQLIADKQTQIEDEYAQIEQLQADTEKQKASVEKLTAQKTEEYEQYQNEIKNSESLAAQYEKEIEEQEELIAKLEEEAARKRQEEEAAKAAKEKAEKEKAEKEKAAKEKAEKETKAASAKNENTATAAPANADDEDESSSSGFTWPCPASHTISSDYGYRTHPVTGQKNKLHSGIDISAPTGTTIVAASSGTVIAASYNSSMGNYVMIDHGGGIVTVYMHCSSLAVSSGQSVRAGQKIAYVGSTGQSTGSHLHFSVRLNGSYVNPWNYL